MLTTVSLVPHKKTQVEKHKDIKCNLYVNKTFWLSLQRSNSKPTKVEKKISTNFRGLWTRSYLYWSQEISCPSSLNDSNYPSCSVKYEASAFAAFQLPHGIMLSWLIGLSLSLPCLCFLELGYFLPPVFCPIESHFYQCLSTVLSCLGLSVFIFLSHGTPFFIVQKYRVPKYFW